MKVCHDMEIDYLRVVRDGFEATALIRATEEETSMLVNRATSADVVRLLDLADGAQVGLGLFNASAWSPAAWWTLPGRSDVPRDLFNAVAEWLGARERTEGER